MIGLYGGTFDPIHNGHLHVARQLLSSGRLTKILLIPSGEPQLKTPPRASGAARLEMCRLALADLKKNSPLSIEVSEIEVNRNGPSYAIDTVQELMREYPGKEFAWIIGSDAYRKIDQWHESKKLQELISFIIIERPASESSTNDSDDSDEFDAVDLAALRISSTEIRARLARGESVDSWLSPAVSRYIRENGLYATQ